MLFLLILGLVLLIFALFGLLILKLCGVDIGKTITLCLFGLGAILAAILVPIIGFCLMLFSLTQIVK